MAIEKMWPNASRHICKYLVNNFDEAGGLWSTLGGVSEVWGFKLGKEHPELRGGSSFGRYFYKKNPKKNEVKGRLHLHIQTKPPCLVQEEQRSQGQLH